MGTILVKVHPVDVEIIDDDRVAAAVLRNGQFEPESLNAWGKLCEKGRANHVIDVGSYGGLFCIAARLMKNGATAIEPKPIMAKRTRANAVLNGIYNLEVIEAAATNYNGQAELGFNPDLALTSGSSLERKGPARMVVKAMTLDSLLGKVPNVGAIKIDVEGHESTVLKGALKLLKEMRPVIIIETLQDEGRKNEVRTILNDYREAAFLDNRNLLMEPV